MNIKFAILSGAAIILAMASCKKEPEQLEVNPCGIAFESTIHFLVVGDDFVQGTSAFPEKSIGHYLSTYEYDESVEEFREFYFENVTADELSTEISSQGITCVNLTAVISGFNDVMQNTDPEQFRTDYSGLLNRLITLSGSSNRVTSSELPDFSVAPGIPPIQGLDSSQWQPTYAARIAAINQVIVEECESRGVNLTDIAILNSIYSNNLGHDSSENGGDDFTPSDLILSQWASPMASSIKENF